MRGSSTSGGLLSTPRPVPSRLFPALIGTAAVVLALPVFLVAGWPLAGWAIAAALWVAFQAVGIALERVPIGADNLVGAGLVAVGRLTRAVVLVGILIAVASSDPSLGLAAAIVYAIAFTVELAASMLSYLVGKKG